MRMKRFVCSGLFLLLISGVTLAIGCAGGGGNTNPVGAQISGSDNATVTSVCVALPVLPMASRQGAIAADGAPSCRIRLMTFDPTSHDKVQVTERMVSLSESDKNVVFPVTTAVLACAEITLNNLVVMESSELHGAIDIQPYTQNLLPWSPCGSRTSADLATSVLSRLASDGATLNRLGAFPRLALIESTMETVASDAATVYEDAWTAFQGLLGDKGLRLAATVVYPLDQLEVIPQGFSPARTSYEASIDDRAVTLTNKEGRLTCMVPDLSEGQHTLWVTVDGWSGSLVFTCHARQGLDDPDTFVRESISVSDADLAGATGPEVETLRAELQSLREEFETLTPVQKRMVAQFISANEEFFRGLAPLPESLRSVRCAIEDTGFRGKLTWDKEYAVFMFYLEDGALKYKIIKKTPNITTAQVDADPRLKAHLESFVLERKKAASLGITDRLKGALRSYFTTKKDTEIFVPTPVVSLGVRGSRRAKVAEELPIFEAGVNQDGLFKAKVRTLEAADFSNGNPDLAKAMSLCKGLKELETSINQGASGTKRFSLGMPDLGALTAKVSEDAYPLSPNLITSTQESIAQSISNPKVKLAGFGLMDPAQDTDSANMSMLFQSDELEDQDFTFVIEYQMTGFPKQAVTVKARVTTNHVEYWDAEQTKKRCEGHRDSQGRRIGKWTEWYETGVTAREYEDRYSSEGDYEFWTGTEYYESGSKRLVREYDVISNKFKDSEYQEDGNLRSELYRLVSSLTPDGPYKWYLDGKLLIKGQFVNGTHAGTWTSYLYYQDGSVNTYTHTY